MCMWQYKATKTLTNDSQSSISYGLVHAEDNFFAGVSFNRGETSHADNEDTEPVTNPEEIDIDEDDDDDDDEPGMKLAMFYFTR